MVISKPKLVFQSTVERRPCFRRFFWWMLGGAAAAGAWAAFSVAAQRQIAEQGLLTAGQWLAIIVLALAILRSLHNLWKGLRRKNETLRFFDQGFVWRRGKTEHKYSWGQVRTFREGARSLYIAGRPVLQRGAQQLHMHDGRVFKVTGIHGDTRQFARAVRPFIADATGIRIGRALRDGKMVKVHPKLALSAKGVVADKNRIPWSALDAAVKNHQLVISHKAASGAFTPVRRYPVHEIDNLGGFMEVATSTIRNHQPERFNIKTQGPPRHA